MAFDFRGLGILPVSAPGRLQRTCAACAAKDGELQRKATDGAPAASSAPRPVHAVLQSPGRPLDTAVRRFMEPRFGHDFSQVRIHTDPAAAGSAAQVNARAYTVGHDVVFGAGQFTPDTAAGRRLLAHELCHVIQQGAGAGAGQLAAQPLTVSNPSDAAEAEADRAADEVMRMPRPAASGRRPAAHDPVRAVQQSPRTPVSGASGARVLRRVGNTPVLQRQTGPGSSASNPPPGYQEAAHPPSFRVKIIAHASPRWRGAHSTAQADRLNLELSKRRAAAVEAQVLEDFGRAFPQGTSVSVDTVIDDQPDGTLGVKAEAHGDRDTLREAHGNRRDNAPGLRRVDVIIDTDQRISGLAGASKPALRSSTASSFWHVKVEGVVGLSLGWTFETIILKLINDKTGESMQGEVKTKFGGGLRGASAKAGIGGSPKGFYTDHPVHFQDFDGVYVRLSTVGVSFVVGYSSTFISFVGMGSGAESIDIGGWSAGMQAGIGGSVASGKLHFSGRYPPTSVPIKGTDITQVPYERLETGGYKYSVFFPTQSAEVTKVEASILDSFIQSVVSSRW